MKLLSFIIFGVSAILVFNNQILTSIFAASTGWLLFKHRIKKSEPTVIEPVKELSVVCEITFPSGTDKYIQLSKSQNEIIYSAKNEQGGLGKLDIINKTVIPASKFEKTNSISMSSKNPLIWNEYVFVSTSDHDIGFSAYYISVFNFFSGKELKTFCPSDYVRSLDIIESNLFVSTNSGFEVYRIADIINEKNPKPFLDLNIAFELYKSPFSYGKDHVCIPCIQGVIFVNLVELKFTVCKFSDELYNLTFLNAFPNGVVVLSDDGHLILAKPNGDVLHEEDVEIDSGPAAIASTNQMILIKSSKNSVSLFNFNLLKINTQQYNEAVLGICSVDGLRFGIQFSSLSHSTFNVVDESLNNIRSVYLGDFRRILSGCSFEKLANSKILSMNEYGCVLIDCLRGVVDGKYSWSDFNPYHPNVTLFNNLMFFKEVVEKNEPIEIKFKAINLDV